MLRKCLKGLIQKLLHCQAHEITYFFLFFFYPLKKTVLSVLFEELINKSMKNY